MDQCGRPHLGSHLARPAVKSLSALLILEASLTLAAYLALTVHAIVSVEVFVLCMALALGIQNGAFQSTGGIGVHTTYLTGAHHHGNPENNLGCARPQENSSLRDMGCVCWGGRCRRSMRAPFRREGAAGHHFPLDRDHCLSDPNRYQVATAYPLNFFYAISAFLPIHAFVIRLHADGLS